MPFPLVMRPIISEAVFPDFLSSSTSLSASLFDTPISSPPEVCGSNIIGDVSCFMLSSILIDSAIYFSLRQDIPGLYPAFESSIVLPITGILLESITASILLFLITIVIYLQ